MCTKVMRLSRVPALRALDTTDFYFRCDNCDYTSAQLTEISGELVCDIHQEADVGPRAFDLIACCDREITTSVCASSARLEDRLPPVAQLPRIAGLPPVRGTIELGTAVTAPMLSPTLRRSAYLPGVTAFRVTGGIAAALVGYAVVASSPPNMHFGGVPKLPSSENRLVTILPLAQAVPPSIELKSTTDGRGTAPKAQSAIVNGTDAMPKPNPLNQGSLPKNANPVLDGQDMGSPSERDMAPARLSSTGVVNVIGAGAVNHANLVFAESNVRHLARAELENLSADRLRIARNEIFARKGRFFNDHKLGAHFANFAWYQPSAWHVRLNLIEEANVGLIRSIEALPHRAHRNPPAAADLEEPGSASPNHRWTPEEPKGPSARTSHAAEVVSIHKD
jgi:hypothetical protein